jgi:prefoldin subunit 5
MIAQKALKGIPRKFSYRDLSAEDHLYVKQMEKDIKMLFNSRDKNTFRIGHALISVKSRLEHGLFIPWVEAELPMSPGTAQRYIKVTKHFNDNSFQLQHLSLSVLYKLADTSVPASIIDAIRSGEITPTRKEIMGLKRSHWSHEEEEKIDQFSTAMALTVQETSPVVVHHAAVQDIMSQIELLRQQVSTIPIQIREVEIEKYVIPLETQRYIEELQRMVDSLITESKSLREASLKLTEINESLSKQNEELSDRLGRLLCSAQGFIDEWGQINKQQRGGN